MAKTSIKCSEIQNKWSAIGTVNDENLEWLKFGESGSQTF